MYASTTNQGIITASNSNKTNVPVETYQNRAVIDELTKRNQSTSCCCPHENIQEDCETRTHEQKQCRCTIETQQCKNADFASGILSKIGIDDAIILLLIILILTDGNSNNDIMLPLLLGVLLLT
jgi:hypothetical protein